MSKGKVLFLHGYTQDANLFYIKTLALRKRLAKLQFEPVFLDGPVVLTPAQLLDFTTKVEKDAVFRAWWTKNADNTYDIEPAIDSVRTFLKKNGPIVGLVGFSQGACFGGALVHTFNELFGQPLEFAVLYLGFKIDTRAMPNYDKLYTLDNGASTKTRLLHVVGELDTVIGEDRAYTFYDTTRKNLHLLKHPGGHFVPNSKPMVEQVASWIAGTESKQKLPELDDIMAMMDHLGG